jgi:ADP-ribose pyrophosphatase
MSVVYKSRVFSLVVENILFPNGRSHEVSIVRHPPSVVLIAMNDARHVILIRQYRPSIGRELWEFPAGSLNAGETAEAAALRECEEEIGLVPQQILRIRGLFPAPGFCDEELIFFRVSDFRAPAPDSIRKPDEDEDIHSQLFTIDEAKAMAERGEIVDLKTAYALTLI